MEQVCDRKKTVKIVTKKKTKLPRGKVARSKPVRVQKPTTLLENVQTWGEQRKSVPTRQERIRKDP